MRHIKIFLLSLCFAAASVHAASVSPFVADSSAKPLPITDITTITPQNARALLRESAPVVTFSPLVTPSPLANLENGPALSLKLAAPAELENLGKKNSQREDVATPKPTKLNSAPQEVLGTRLVNAFVATPLIASVQDKSSRTGDDPLPPAVWLLGIGLLGLVGISRRDRVPQ